MLCIVAVFLPSFFMEGAARALFIPMALAVGFAMLTSYFLSSTFVPVLSVWLLRHHAQSTEAKPRRFSFARLRAGYARALAAGARFQWGLVAAYACGAGLLLWLAGGRLGTEIFPTVDEGQFQLRVRGPTGTRIERTEEMARQVLEIVKEEAGAENVDTTVAFGGVSPSSYNTNTVYLWTAGPEEAVVRVAVKHASGVRVEALKQRLRLALPERLGEWLRRTLLAEGLPEERVAERVRGLRFSFEPADIVNEVMSFGSRTPVEVAVSGPTLADNRIYAQIVRSQLARISSLRDLQFVQSFDYPTVEVKVDRELAGLGGITMEDATRSLVAATSSSRFVVPNYWRDPATGVGYQVQIEIPPSRMDTAQEVGMVPIKRTAKGQVLLRDVAGIGLGTMPGEYDRYNMRRVVSLTANIEGDDLGRVAGQVEQAIAAAGVPPRGVTVDVRGQVVPMRQMFHGLVIGLGLAIIAILLLLTAYFQSQRLAVVVLTTVPAVLAGVALALLVTGTTLNIQSFMGAIMAVGIAVANAILLVTFAERSRRGGASAFTAAVDGAQSRLRPILMTSFAMLAGMIPLALGLGEGGEQTAPLGRAVIGGLAAATMATLTVLPVAFGIIQSRSSTRSASLHPHDPEASCFVQPVASSANTNETRPQPQGV